MVTNGIIIFIIFAFMGWGRNGFGGNNGGGSDGIGSNYVLASDFAQISRQLDSGFDRLGNRIENVNNGLCDGFYAMAQQFSNTNQNIFNGNSAIQQTLCQGFAGINNAITTNGYETRLGTQGLASQLAQCCCDVRQEIADCCCKTNANIKDVNYNIAMQTNALQNTLCNTTRDIIDNQNANYRALHDEIVANRIEDKNAQIQAQQNEINALRLSASQNRQTYQITNDIIDRLSPCPRPSYVVPNPNCCYNFGFTGFNNGCGCNSGCGCN